MNEFIEQFLLEGRELVAQATDDLLALEQNPADAARLDSAFRSFHTLKGGAGIIEFPEMVRALHAVEDVLASARTGDRPLAPVDIGDCLWALDQVVQWLDEMEASGEVPANSSAKADEVVRRVAHLGGRPKENAPVPRGGEQAGDWVSDLLVHNRAVARAAVSAVRYVPDAQCFFRNEDPLALVARFPGLLAIDAHPVAPWPALEQFDPFACNLVITALLSIGEDAVRQHVAATADGVLDRFQFVHIEPSMPFVQAPLAATARAVLEAQLALLAKGSDDGAAGRLGAARRVVVNILKRVGRAEHAEAIERNADPSLISEARNALAAGIRQALGEVEQVFESGLSPVKLPADTVIRSLRVSVERIDALVNLTGELTVAKNALGHAATLARAGADAEAIATLLGEQQARLERLVGELQRSVLSIRLLPMRQVLQRFPRLVRDLSLELGKPATLVTEGEETEADKAVVEALAEPLLHVVRNAIDHGIEAPADRLRAGKPPTATIHLRAQKVDQNVVVEVEDDGKGIDLARVRQVAIERHLASAVDVAAMTDTDALQLIFAPGFSTAAAVSTVSGRGVGMDAVRSAVGRIGGSVEVDTRAGQGTTIRFILPFSVMMTPVMTVEAAGQIFGVPLDGVIETIRISQDRIAHIGRARAFVHRQRTIPLVDLAGAMGEPRQSSSDRESNVVIASVDNEFCGIEVDRVGDRVEVMLKPVDSLLAGLTGLAGLTILGDGRVMLVLDVKALLE